MERSVNTGVCWYATTRSGSSNRSQRTQGSGSPRRLSRPEAVVTQGRFVKRWGVPHVLCMTAAQEGGPVAVIIKAEAGDGPIHKTLHRVCLRRRTACCFMADPFKNCRWNWCKTGSVTALQYRPHAPGVNPWPSHVELSALRQFRSAADTTRRRRPSSVCAGSRRRRRPGG